MANFRKTKSISRRLALTVLIISIFCLVEFVGLYFSSQNYLQGISEFYELNQVTENLENVKKLINSVEEGIKLKRPGGISLETRAIYQDVIDQARQLLSNSITTPHFQREQISQLVRQAQVSTADFWNTVQNIPPKDPALSAQTFIALQLALETRELCNKAQIQLGDISDQIFTDIYGNRFTPLLVSLSLALVLICFALFLGLRISRHLDRSLQNILSALQSVSKGDLNARASVVAADEIGEISMAFNQMTENLAHTTVSRNYIEGIIESMLDCVVVLDPTGHIVRVNRVMSKTFGYDSSELISQPIEMILPELSFPRENKLETETKAVSRTGRSFPISFSLSPLEIEKGLSGHFVLVIRDITNLKETEQELKDRNLDLSNANRELEAFSYSVSHDLRAPLRSVDGFSQALEEDFGTILPEEAKLYLVRIRTAIQKMGKLIDDMLNLSRITRAAINPVPVDLSQIVQEITTEIESQEPNRHVETNIEGHVEAIADPSLIRVALQNLIGNAWKYTSKHPEAHIKFGVTSDKLQRPVFYIRDDGAGFDMAYSKKLFGAFQRLHGNSEFPGTGVGLATVQRIIHRHGGQIWAESEVEKGSTFYFTL
jgi:PAS domain S-box-containing protein